MKRKLLFSLSVLFLIVVLGGCATERIWVYRAEPRTRGTPLADKSVAVGLLHDLRENRNTDLTALYLIPLMPFGWMNYNMPEGAMMHLKQGAWLFRPSEDFAKAIAEELDNAGIFREAFFAHRPSEADFEFRGEIKSTFYHAKMLTYGVSAGFGVLWMAGFPAAYVRNDLNLSFQLIDNGTGEILWQQEYAKSRNFITWAYAWKSDFMYDLLLKDIMMETLPSLRSRFAGYSSRR